MDAVNCGVRLLPQERDRLELFLAAELARRRRGRGLRLSQAEAVAVIADETMELARDGLPYAEVERRAYGLIGPDDVQDGVAALVERIELEPLFADGPRLMVLLQPVARDGPPDLTRELEPHWLPSEVTLAVENLGAVVVSVTSHFHFFETNRVLRFDRRAAWGMRLATTPGSRSSSRPARRGRRVWCRSAAPGSSAVTAASSTARWTTRERWKRRSRSPASGGMPMPAPDPIQLGDGDLWVTPEADDASGPDEIVPGWGGNHRDGLGVRAERGGVDIAVVGGLVLDPVLGVRRTSIGVRGGRICAVGRAGNPDTMDGIEVVLDAQTALLDARGLIVTPGAVDSHMHWLSPQLAETALAGGVTTFVAQDFGPVWNLGANPADCLATAWAALESVPINVAFLVRASSSRPEGVEESLAAGGAGLKIHEDVAAGPEQLRCALDVADRHDVQLAIHTDGLNEALLAADTARVLAGRTVHLYHIEGAGGGHAPDLLSLAGRERFLTSSTNPTVPYGVGAEAEHLAMVAAVHLLEPGTRPGDATILRERVRPWTMAAETVLHDLGVISILSSDSQGMGRVGETLRRAFQCAAVMKVAARPRLRAGRQRARPALSGQGHDQPGRRTRTVGRRGLAPGRPPRRPGDVVAHPLSGPARARAEGGHAGVGRVGQRQTQPPCWSSPSEWGRRSPGPAPVPAACRSPSWPRRR